MVQKTAAVVTMDDLKNYFKGAHWSVTMLTDDNFEAHNSNFEVSFKMVDPVYKVHIESTEDPTDSVTETTSNPADVFKEFFGTESAMKKVSSPEVIGETIRILAAQVQLGEISRAKFAGDVRRLIIALESTAADAQTEEIGRFKKWVDSMGWRAKLSETDNGMKSVEINIGDMYNAVVSLESFNWKYSIAETGSKSGWKTGKTQDPIAEFRRFYKGLVPDDSPESEERPVLKNDPEGKTTPV